MGSIQVLFLISQVYCPSSRQPPALLPLLLSLLVVHNLLRAAPSQANNFLLSKWDPTFFESIFVLDNYKAMFDNKYLS